MSGNTLEKFASLPPDFLDGGKGLSSKGGQGDPSLSDLVRGLALSGAVIDLPPVTWTLEDGSPIDQFADGNSAVPGFAQVVNKVSGIRWNNFGSPGAIARSVALPALFGAPFGPPGLEFHAYVAKVGATVADAVTFDVEAYFHPLGSVASADADAGGTSSAIVGDATSQTVQEVSLLIADADVPSGPSALSLVVKPTDGTLGTDDLVLVAAWLEVVLP